MNQGAHVVNLNPPIAAPASGRSGRLPGESGVFLFVLFDMCFFALMFGGFMAGRAEQHDVFDESRALLNVTLGTVNTMLLLTSSWFMALACHSGEDARPARVDMYLFLAVATGASFIAIKLTEYGAKFDAGLSMLTNDFFMWYFILTGLHLLHVLVGLIVLTVLWFKARSARGVSPMLLESAGTYWHMVDLLWVMLFLLLYLL